MMHSLLRDWDKKIHFVKVTKFGLNIHMFRFVVIYYMPACGL